MRRSFVWHSLSLLLLAGISLTAPARLDAQKLKPYLQMCGPPGNPCIPKIFWNILRFRYSGSLPPESGPYTYMMEIANNGGAGGWYTITCVTTPQLPCQQASTS